VRIRLGTRASALALTQARLVAELLPAAVELVPLTTAGDRDPTDDKSRFVKELEEALLADEIDLAVHSAKDVPAALPEGLAILGIPARADPRDALCGAAALEELPQGAVVGTASLRRQAQLRALRPDLDVRELRGNVDTRLERLAEGDYGAIVLAQAGLDRLGRGDEGTPLGELVPAAGQGCLALEGRPGDHELTGAAAAITDREALMACMAERALVEALEASCHTPVGAHASLVEGALRLTAFVGLPDGSHWIRDERDGDPDHPVGVGRTVAERLIAAGAGEVLAQAETARGG
jgi:hydroxymethylbilane synthase